MSANQRGRLERVYDVDEAPLPLRVHHARRVEPEEAQRAVAGQQFLYLRLGFAAEVLVEILLAVGAEVPVVSGAVGLVPVLRLGVIEAELHVVSGAGRRQFLQRVAMERRPIDHVVLAHRRVVHGKAVVVLGRDDDVLYAGIFGELHPGLGIELDRIELGGEALVVLYRNPGIVHDPFAEAGNHPALPFTGGNGIKPPVDEQRRISPRGTTSFWSPGRWRRRATSIDRTRPPRKPTTPRLMAAGIEIASA